MATYLDHLQRPSGWQGGRQHLDHQAQGSRRHEMGLCLVDIVESEEEHEMLGMKDREHRPADYVSGIQLFVQRDECMCKWVYGTGRHGVCLSGVGTLPMVPAVVFHDVAMRDFIHGIPFMAERSEDRLVDHRRRRRT